jgi:uncharacterized membrane protein
MLFLVILLIGTAVASAVLALLGRHSIRHAARLGMAFAMVVAGITHLADPTPFVQHLPLWVPLREELVFATGLVEIGLGVALLLRQPSRRSAGLVLAGYLVAVFPSNVYVAVAGIDVDGQPGGAYPWLRLPLQLLFLAWALWSTRPEPSTHHVSAGPALEATTRS